MEKYIVVEVHNLKKFLIEVNKKVNQGYLPIGGLECPVRGLYIQAMIFKDVKCTD